MKSNKISQKIGEMFERDSNRMNYLLQEGLLSEGYDNELRKIHEENSEILDEIIRRNGFPTKRQFDDETVEKAWIIYQHSISKPEFMLKHLATIKKLSELGEINKSSYPKTIDRIKVLQGYKQIFGTNFDWTPDGKFLPTPIEDLANVDKIRKLYDLTKLKYDIERMQDSIKKSEEKMPKDYNLKKKAELKFLKSVGWR